ncbi:MAG: rhomboid family intramembrane serine protease [Mucilaginibacter sp.]
MNAYRQSPFANLTPVVKNLLIINIIFFVATFLLHQTFDMQRWLAAYYFNAPDFRLWQIISYMFMHAGINHPEHILFNMFALFMFGPILEYSIGSKRFLNIYVISGLGALLIQMLVQAIEVHGITGGFTISHPELESSFLQFGPNAQKLFDIYNTPVVGASGAIFGIVVAFAMLYPNMEMMILFIPVPIKAKYIIPGYIVIELFSGIGQFSGDNVAHFAHIGGALFGFIMVKIWRLQRPNNFF